MLPTLHTRRLTLRAPTLADAPRAQQLFPQWEVVQFLNASVPWPYPPDGTLTHLRDHVLPAIARGDAWHWLICLNDSPQQHIGAIELMRGDFNRGFWLAPEFHRQGLMLEAVCAANDFWFDTLGFDVLRSPKAVANQGSRRLSEKTGMRIIATEERDFVSGRLPSEIWEITAGEWRTHRKTLTY